MKQSRPIDVLIVEDDDLDAHLIERAFARSEMLEVKTRHITRLGELADALGHGEPDVVLLDLTLPDSTGLDTLDRARQLIDTALVLVMTGLDDDDVGIAALRRGAEEYVRKSAPGMAQLARTVRYALERRTFRARDIRSGLYDNRTGLPTRSIFIDRLTMAMRRADLKKTALAVAMLRVDELSTIGQRHGKLAGDIFERALIKRLTHTLALADTLALLGDGEYGCVIESLVDATQGRGLSRLLARALMTRVPVPTLRTGVLDLGVSGVSIGLGFYPEDGRTVSGLIDAAIKRTERFSS